jgi:hypothetical protein
VSVSLDPVTVLIGRSGDKIVVSHSIGGRTLVQDLDQESEGVRHFMAYLIALYQSPPKQTLIFEEPETGLHPGGLAALAEQFKACPGTRTSSRRTARTCSTTSPREPVGGGASGRSHPDRPDRTGAVRGRSGTVGASGELLTVDQARIAEAVGQW